MAQLSERFNDEQYKNWLKVGHALVYLKKGITNLVECEIQHFQRDILEKCKINMTQPGCVTCTSKDLKRQRKSFKLSRQRLQ